MTDPVRRLDWRFLLPPTPRRSVVIIGAAADVCDAAVAVRLGDEAFDTLPSHDGAAVDLVAVLCGGDCRVADIVSTLRPGGYLYWELDRRSSPTRTPQRVADELHRNGLVVDGVWAVRPHLERAETFIPIDAPGPLPWFLRQRYDHRRPVQRLASTALHALLRGNGMRAQAVSPFSALVAHRSSEGPEGGTKSPEDTMPTPMCTTLMFVDGGNRAVQLRFPHGGSEPTEVLKIPKLTSFADRTLNEHHMLGEVRRALGPPLDDSVPRPVAVSRWAQVDMAIETPVAGESLTRTCSRRTPRAAEAALADAVTWSIELARRSARPDPMTDDELQTHIVGPLHEYLRSFGTESSELIRRAADSAARLHASAPLPFVIRHRDYNLWNLIRRPDGALGVIDWEGAEHGPPMTDVIHFSTHWHEAVTRRRPITPDPERFRDVFVHGDRQRRTSSAILEHLDRYVAAVGLDPAWRPTLTVATWVELALRRRKQITDGRISDVDGQRDTGAHDTGAHDTGAHDTGAHDIGAHNVGVQYMRLLQDDVDAVFRGEGAV